MRTLILALSALLACGTLRAQRSFDLIHVNTMNGTKTGAIDTTTGDTILHPVYDDIKSYSASGYFDVVKNGKMGVVDTNDKVVIPIKYQFCTNIYQGRAFVGNGGNLAMVDKTGKLLTGFIYETVTNFIGGFSRVQMKGLYGYVNRSAQLVIPCRYIEGGNFIAGLVLVQTDRWEHIANAQTKNVITKEKHSYNVGMTVKIPIVYNSLGKAVFVGKAGDNVAIVDNGNIVVTRYSSDYDRTLGEIMDKTGKMLFPLSKHYEFKLSDTYILVNNRDNYHYGIMDYSGNEILKANFKEIQPITLKDGSQYFKATFDNDEYFYADSNGKCLEIEGVKCPK
jgi:hypothetical protein